MGRTENGSVLCIGDDAVRLNLRCALLKEHGWSVFSSTTGHEALIRVGQEPLKLDAAVLDLDSSGKEAALIAGELKRLRPKLPIVMLVSDGIPLTPGATQQADVVIAKSEETSRLVVTLRGLLGS